MEQWRISSEQTKYKYEKSCFGIVPTASYFLLPKMATFIFGFFSANQENVFWVAGCAIATQTASMAQMKKSATQRRLNAMIPLSFTALLMIDVYQASWHALVSHPTRQRCNRRILDVYQGSKITSLTACLSIPDSQKWAMKANDFTLLRLYWLFKLYFIDWKSDHILTERR